MSFAIETIDLVKNFSSTRAVDGVNLQIQQGSVFGLLGPNGAGKTTTVRLLATLLKPDSGQARVLGHDLVKEPAAVRAKVSLTGQFASVDDELTGNENLILIARLLGYSWASAKKRANDLLQAFNLVEASGRQVQTYSGGMRRRLDIAASLVLTPQILFLDEPTTGLDPRSRNQVWDIVRAIARQGTTVLLTTQYLEEADQLADRLAVIDHGKLIAEGTSRELKASVGSGALKVQLNDVEQRHTAVAIIENITQSEVLTERSAEWLTVQVDNEGKALDILSALQSGQIKVNEFSLGSPSLDEVFFALTGKTASQQPEGPEKEDVPHESA